MRRLINFWGGPWGTIGIVVGALLSLLVAYVLDVDASPTLVVGLGAGIGMSLGYYLGERRKERQAS